MRAAIYTRISLDRDGTGLGVARQQKDCETLCNTRGWTVTTVVQENDTSATKGKRPGYDRLVRLAEDRKVEIVVAWAVDRLTRTPREIEDLIDLSERTGVKIATVAGDLDLTTDTGRLVGRILGSVARGEVERKGARQRRANLQRAEQGIASPGGIRTVGYTPGLTAIVEQEAAHIRAGFAGLLAGLSLKEIARQWNAAGMTTAHGGQWNGSNVRFVLRNPRYAAYTKHRGRIIGKGKWTPIVGEDMWHAAQTVLDDPSRKTTDTGVRRYLLAGLALCECGAKVTTGRTQHGVRTYRCSRQRGHMSRAALDIDDYVTDHIVHRLTQPDAITLLADTGQDVADLQDRANALRARIAELAATLADPAVPMLETQQAIRTCRANLADLGANMAADVLGPLITAEDTEAAWKGYSLAQKRAAIQALVTVTLHAPGKGRRRFNPDTVTITSR